MSEAALCFDHVSKRFRLGETHDSLVDLAAYAFRRVTGAAPRQSPDSTFWALRDVSFEVPRGGATGIIGPNGAGKSTALKLLAGILRAERGEVRASGRLAALIEVGAGFHADLTGRENIFLNGAILGMTRAEIRTKLDSIVEFAGLERFLDTPVKRYSSGMYARLGFSIAAHVDPDILLVDEVLSVGDAVFRLRCEERMRQLVRDGTTLIFVTHNLEQMQSICDRAIVLEEGRTAFDGPAREAVSHYMTAMTHAYTARPADLAGGDAQHDGAGEVLGVRILDRAGKETVWLRPRDEVRAEVRFKLVRPIEKLTVELNLRASASENLISINSGRDNVFFDTREGVNTVTLVLPAMPLASGRYFWNVRMWDGVSGDTVIETPFKYPTVIDDEGRATGALSLDHAWSYDGAAASQVVDTPAEPAPIEAAPAQCGSGT